MSDTREQLSPVSVALHWIIGLTIIGMVLFGMYIAGLPKTDPNKLQLIFLHRSIGILVLAFASWRIIHRLRMGFPENVGSYQTWERHLAKTVQVFLLLATLAMPLSGIVFSVASGRSIELFGLPFIPVLMQKNQEIAQLARGTHEILGKLVLLAVAFHIAGALKHHMMDRDGTLKRMLGARIAPRDPAILAAAATAKAK